MKNVNSNLVSANVFEANQYAEFTTLFRIPFKAHPGKIDAIKIDYTDILGSWADVCIKALNARMDACVSMLFRNRNNVIYADQHEIAFCKNNGMLHTFRHASFKAMEDMVSMLEVRSWKTIKDFPAGIAQLRKALYWVSEDDKKEQGCIGFGQLISCLEELEMMARLHIND